MKVFNDCDPENVQEKERLLQNLFGSVGEGVDIQNLNFLSN